ncbi:recombinase family protein [Sphingobium sp.]|uniref:recombinase family protein n=1 Tax=Sphingobium sp. TaxID=1912891 RepID=UPI002B5D6E0B|nr:recombinase family protein [Sphingobium sp.]HUD90135.1 recombinase family protein [Sphingobium sp.]
MNENLKVQSHHLERGAYLYIRQSSMRQVMENVESTKRQYALRGRATGLRWRDDQISVIDSDQGESGASASWREGFQHLVSDVGMGRAGIHGPGGIAAREKQRGLASIAGNLRLGRHADPR